METELIKSAATLQSAPVILWYVIAGMFVFIDILVVMLIFLGKSKWDGMAKEVHGIKEELHLVVTELTSVKTVVNQNSQMTNEMLDLRKRVRQNENAMSTVKAVMVAKGWMTRDSDIEELQ